jgi:hypothetical protein
MVGVPRNMPASLDNVINAAFRWHHRVLGALWGLCGLVEIGVFLSSGRWAEYQMWIALLVATTYAAAGIGFIFGRAWARWTMAGLMVVAVLLLLDLMLMFAFNGEREGVWEMLAALGIAGYTLLFLAISEAYRYKHVP